MHTPEKTRPSMTVAGTYAGILLATFAAILYGYFQALPAPCEGAGDCVKYGDMARAFAAGSFGPIEYPFNLRILGPWLAAQLGSDPTQGFQILDVIAAMLFAVATGGICWRLKLGPLACAAILAWFFLHPLGFRLYQAVPMSADPLAYALFALTAFLFVAQQRIAMLLTLCVGMLAKESFAFAAMLAIAAELVFAAVTRDTRARNALLAAGGALAVLVAYGIVKRVITTSLFPQTQGWEITALSTFDWWGREVLKDPQRLLVWAGAALSVTGILPALLIGGGRTNGDAERIRTFTYFGLGAAGFVVLGLLAGADMSRIIFNGNTFIMTFLFALAHTRRYPPAFLAGVVVISLAIALAYTGYFPSAFEYDYYGSHDITKTRIFALFVGGLTLVAGLVLRGRGTS